MGAYIQCQIIAVGLGTPLRDPYVPSLPQVGSLVPSMALSVLASLISASSNSVFCSWWRSGNHKEALASHLSYVTPGIMCKVMPSSPNLLWPWAEGHGVCADPVPLGIAQVTLMSFSLCQSNLEVISCALPFRLYGCKARKHMRDAWSFHLSPLQLPHRNSTHVPRPCAN